MPRFAANLILQAYCAGEVTWRQAAAQLDLDNFSAFRQALDKAGLNLYEPDAKTSKAKLAALDAILDKGL